VEPGVTTELHRLDVDEWYVIVAGSGSMEIDGAEAFEVGAGDTVSIPRGRSQRITNSGAVDLRFQCICLPRFREAGYEPLE
jgi:mannose-6-phosphate isomerase-like protein (cupin superfamily)